MQRDMDLIRDLLMDIEDNEHITGHYTLTDRDFGVPSENIRKVQYHLRLLMDANYIKGVDGQTVMDVEMENRQRNTWHGAGNLDVVMDRMRDEASQLDNMTTAPMIMISRMTWAGHEFTDTVRDPVVWEKTKESMKGLGNFGIEGVKALAKGFLKQQVQKHTGIEMDF